MRRTLQTVTAVAGATSVAVGVALLSVPAALIVAGVEVVAGSYVWAFLDTLTADPGATADGDGSVG